MCNKGANAGWVCKPTIGQVRQEAVRRYGRRILREERDVGRCGEMWGDVGRCGGMWGGTGAEDPEEMQRVEEVEHAVHSAVDIVPLREDAREGEHQAAEDEGGLDHPVLHAVVLRHRRDPLDKDGRGEGEQAEHEDVALGDDVATRARYRAARAERRRAGVG